MPDLHYSAPTMTHNSPRAVLTDYSLSQTSPYPTVICQPPRHAYSTNGFIRVLGYTPSLGNAREALRVVAQISPHPQLQVQLMVGDIPRPTTLTLYQDPRFNNAYLISAILPPFSGHESTLTVTIPLWARILHDGHVLDEVQFGEYTYLDEPAREPVHPSELDHAGEIPSPFASPARVALHFWNPTQEMCVGWDREERAVGRRLVRFGWAIDAERILVTCDAVSQRTFDADPAGRKSAAHVVVSCIWRRETGAHCITSVDMLRLLELLYGETVCVEEKNRVRRHLERFAPCAIGRRREGADFYNDVVAKFPNPKPLNIQKDIKVFDWSVLEEALESIMYRRVCVFWCASSHGVRC